MTDKLLAPTLSVIAILGPVSYCLLAMYEIGRLNYFHAPIEFIQLGSFGVHDVLEKVYLTLIPIVGMLALFYRVKFLQGGERLRALTFAVGVLSFIVSRLSVSQGWGLFFLVVAALCVMVGLRKGQAIDLGNEAEKEAIGPQTPAQIFESLFSRSILLLAFLFIMSFVFVLAGAKDAAVQQSYWCSDDEVLLGFYGDKVLTSKINDGVVGPGFFIKEVKDLENEISYRGVGPLRAAARWEISAKPRRGPIPFAR